MFTRARDALFELLDALLVPPGVRSFTELCLAGTFRRQWPSLDAAIQNGRLDRDALERFLAAQVPAPGVALSALDTTLWPPRWSNQAGLYRGASEGIASRSTKYEGGNCSDDGRDMTRHA